MLDCSDKSHQSILVGPMPKKEGTFKEQTRKTLKTKYRIDFMSSKEGQEGAIFESSNACRYDDD